MLVRLASPIYNPRLMSRADPQPRKPLISLAGPIKTPPFSSGARVTVGRLLGRLQDGESIGLPMSRPMPSIGRGCHELRVGDGDHSWRVVYRIDDDAIVVAAIFPKGTRATPKHIIQLCKARLVAFDGM